jgi:hypothetical protein
MEAALLTHGDQSWVDSHKITQDGDVVPHA